MLKVVHDAGEFTRDRAEDGGSLLDEIVREGARQMLAAAEGGSEITDGSYLPRLARAKKIASLADTYGLWNA